MIISSGPNTGKDGPEKTLYLDTFERSVVNSFSRNLFLSLQGIK